LNSQIADLQHIDHNVRASVVLELGKQCEASTVSSLIQALRVEQEFFVREYITWALVRMRDVAVVPLIALLKDNNPVVRHAAAHTLSKIGDGRAFEALIEALQDDDTTVVSKAAFALGRIGNVKAIPTLVTLLGHDRPEFRSSLGSVLETFGDDAVNPLIQALDQDNWRAREQAAEILGIIGSEQASAALIKTLSDESWQVRFAAVYALGHVGGKAANDALQMVHDDTNQLVRNLVPKMIERIKTKIKIQRPFRG
jgi:HEAT repeat protein